MKSPNDLLRRLRHLLFRPARACLPASRSISLSSSGSGSRARALLYGFCAAVVLAAGCERLPGKARPVAKPWKAAAMAHGGAGAPPAYADGCKKAVEAALKVVTEGGDPLDAAVFGVAILEDDPRYNAGTGSRVRLDERTVQMDASVMASDGRFGAVAAVEGVRNPVRVARAVVDTPHLLLVGDGATRFARTLGFSSYDPTTPAMREKTRGLLHKLRVKDPSLPPEWQRFDWRRHWNFERGVDEVLSQAGAGPDRAPPGPRNKPDLGSDTVGVVVRTADGRFAAALSTGGTAMTLRGRIGDVPIHGAGQFAGPYGAAAATGTGERIIETALARTVHGWLAEGVSAKEAADRAIALVRDRGDIGIIVLSPDGLAASASDKFAWAGREAGGPWLGP